MSSAPAQAAGQKRKAVATSSADRKRQKTQNIREIPVLSRDAAVSATGELDVASFIKSREYEINALEKSIQKSKKGLTMRAFQQVPRSMRRRTASHNVKKVPGRLRRRAKREVSGIHGQGPKPRLAVMGLTSVSRTDEGG
jgi:ribonuclease P/MRP protein subunit POP1